jgi:uncharacterized membrane protein
MLKMTALLAASLMLATPALSQQAPAAGMSDSAKLVLKENIQKRDADLAPLIAKKRDLQKKFDALLTPESYDEAQLAATMAEMRAVEGEIVERTGNSMLALLKALPEEDRGAFFNTLKRPGPQARTTPQGSTGR